MRRKPLWLAAGLAVVALLGCRLIGFAPDPATLSGPAYWAAETGTAVPTAAFFLGTSTPVYGATAEPVLITTTPEWTTVTPDPGWVTTTPVYLTTTPAPPVVTTPGLPIFGFPTPEPQPTAYYRIGTFYMNSDVYIGGPTGLVVRLIGHERRASPRNGAASYHFLTIRVTNYTPEPQRVPLSDLFFIRRVHQGAEVVTGRWTPENEPLNHRGLPSYEAQQLEMIPPDGQREIVLGFVVPTGEVREVGLITDWNRPVEGGLPIWFYLADDPLEPFVDAFQPPPPTPVILDDGSSWAGSGPPRGGDGLWPTTGVVTRGFGCHPLYTGIDGAGFGCPPERRWFHNGVDIANVRGTPIWSPVNGEIVFAGPNRTGADCSSIPGSEPPHEGLGNYQRLSGGGTAHTLGHLSAFRLTAGPVAAGEIVAEMGSTGCSTGTHLHWIVYQSGVLIDPALWAGPGPSP